MSKILVGSNFTGFKNRIINGDFSVWQKGTSTSLLADGTYGAGAYVADRVYSYVYFDTNGGITVSKGSIDGRDSYKVTVDSPFSQTSETSYFQPFRYAFEGQHLFDIANNGSSIAISFLFKSNVTGKFSVSLRNDTDVAVNRQSFVSVFEYANADTAQRVELAIPLDFAFNPAIRNDENRGFVLNIGFLNFGRYTTTTIDSWLDNSEALTTPESVNWGAAVGNYIEIAGLQVEEGEYATAFEKVPYDIQLLRCQRYYCDLGSVYLLKYADTSIAFAQVALPVQMRVNPTVEIYKETLVDMSFFASYTDKNILTEYYTIDAAGGYGAIYARLSAEL